MWYQVRQVKGLELTVLGCHAPYAPADGACNGYLLQAGGVNIMLDCGNGSFAVLQKHLDFRKLHALIISHYHPDHFHDYHCVRHAIGGSIRDGSRQNPLLVYAPGAETGPWNEMAKWQDEFILIPIEEYQRVPASLGDLVFHFQKNKHPKDCFSMNFIEGNAKFVYTSDTSWYGPLVEFAWGADFLLCEASLRNADMALSEEKGHLTAGQAGRLAAKAEVKHLMLTHLWPEFPPYVLLREAQSVFAGKVSLATTGLKISI
ncbi:MAG: MBL fold metallo-hydrolase [Bacillota bacterium]|nr:MBL fold metallo-hydrolase [Thermanaerosceptrum fracticalcis]